jgi:DNA-binding GntR family transcriptional regulator
MWSPHDERQRNEVALREHLIYIDALLGRNLTMIELACRAHLTTAKETLIRSTSGLHADV